jgi:hypothetical protein
MISHNFPDTYRGILEEAANVTKAKGKGDPRFHAILKEMGELHDRKQQDYGTDEDPLANIRASTAWGLPAWAGAMLRGGDKLKRLQTFLKTGKLANEGARDAFLDLAVYSILGLILFDEEQQHKALLEGPEYVI